LYQRKNEYQASIRRVQLRFNCTSGKYFASFSSPALSLGVNKKKEKKKL
jgi:hypothetical protein